MIVRTLHEAEQPLVWHRLANVRCDTCVLHAAREKFRKIHKARKATLEDTMKYNVISMEIPEEHEKDII